MIEKKKVLRMMAVIRRTDLFVTDVAGFEESILTGNQFFNAAHICCNIGKGAPVAADQFFGGCQCNQSPVTVMWLQLPLTPEKAKTYNSIKISK